MRTQQIQRALSKAFAASLVTGTSTVGAVDIASSAITYNDAACWTDKRFIGLGGLFAATSIISFPFWAIHFYKQENQRLAEQEIVKEILLTNFQP